MTTIAATRDALAGDRMVYDDGRSAWYPSIKVRRVRDMLIGAAGDSGDCVRLMDWAEAGFSEKKKPKFVAAGTEEAATLLIVDKDGIKIMGCNDPYPEAIAESTYAIGSGGKAAWAALQAGLPLDKAMEIAATVDPYTRAPFDVLTLK